jgi:uncharacterized protein YraI
MYFSLVAALTLFSASALAEPIPQDATLSKRADNWCRVVTNVNCRKGPGVSYDEVKVEGLGYVPPGKKFGVRCTKEGSNVEGDKTW